MTEPHVTREIRFLATRVVRALPAPAAQPVDVRAVLAARQAPGGGR